MQVPLLSGIAASESGEFSTSYPVNLEPVPIDSKISKGQLRLASGTTPFGAGPGIDRGGILWNDILYRVMGTSLVRVNGDGSVITLGDVGEAGSCGFDYSFDRLAIRSGARLFYWNGSTLTEVTDPDLGSVRDHLWIDGYFMTTDGTSIVVTELSDPTSVNPLKYGSAEVDPDPVTGLIKVKQTDEVFVAGRYTFQIFQNVGGNGFPFQPVRGGTIPHGCVGPTAKTLFAGSFAFVGSARDEALGVYIAGDGSAAKISTRAVDDALAALEDPASIEVERRVYRDEQRLIVHLPNESWTYLLKASAAVQEPVWHRLQSGLGSPYRPRNAVLAYGKMIVGDVGSAALAVLSEESDAHFGETFHWGFDAGLIYNQGKGGLVHSIELVGLPGRGGDSHQFLSMTKDGISFDPEHGIRVEAGERRKRLQWRPHRRFSNYLGLRFRGYGGLPGFAAIEADVRPLRA
jgi:hypothetical protein